MQWNLWLLATGLAYAQYFPLEVGNQWIYRVDEGPVKEVRMAEVVGREAWNGREYFVYRGIQGEQSRIRLTANNELAQRNADGSESLWADFNAGEGTSFATGLDGCTGRGKVESRTAKAEVLNRAWENGIRVSYAAAGCADAGVSEDLYVPGLGLAERTYQSFTGPRRYKLTYSRIGNATVIAGGESSFRVNLSQRSYPARAPLQVRMTLENGTKEPLTLRFRSGQSFDFAVRDASGATVYTWSANKRFTAEAREVTVTGEKNWTAAEEVQLPAGEYVLEAWLTTEGKPVFRAQVPMTIAEIVPEK